jgi:hypothetical protein
VSVKEKRESVLSTMVFINDHFRCEYKLAGTDGWEINVENVDCDQWFKCKKRLSITLGGFRIVASGTHVTVDNIRLNDNQGYVNGRK